MLLPSTQGAEADGQYPWERGDGIERRGLCRVKVIAPDTRDFQSTAPEPDLLFGHSSPEI